MGKDTLIEAKDAVCVARSNEAGEFTDLLVAPEHGAEADIARTLDLVR